MHLDTSIFLGRKIHKSYLLFVNILQTLSIFTCVFDKVKKDVS